MHGNQLFDTNRQILSILFDREFTNIRKREQDLINKHISLGGSKDGFRYMGVIYSGLAGAARGRGNYDRPGPELITEIGTLMTDKKVLEADRERMKQALTLVLRDTRSPQDIRDALPNCLRDLVPGIERLERTRPEGYTLKDNPRAYSQYMQIRPKIEFYVAARLLY